MIEFRVDARSGEARTGVLVTPHGDVPTPAFMPVATQGTVKGLDAADISALGVRLAIMNTYHLWLRPGPEVVAAHGGLHAFTRFPAAIVTDSGGFQAFSLAERTRVSETGVEFSSHLDGRRLLLSPEEAMRVQGLLGSDIAMQLDICPPGGSPRAELVAAVERTTRWAERCLATTPADGQARFGIVQGGSFLDLRRQHLATLASMPFEGIALGGFSVGEAMSVTYELLGELGAAMPRERPRYLMGVGKPIDLLRAIGAGIDMFDCVLPTRNARNGQALTWNGRVNLKQSRHRKAAEPIDPECPCSVCGTFSRAYLRHLFAAGEMLGPRLLTQHNLFFYQALTRAAQVAIRERRYAAFAREAEERMVAMDEVKTGRGQ